MCPGWEDADRAIGTLYDAGLLVEPEMRAITTRLAAKINRYICEHAILAPTPALASLQPELKPKEGRRIVLPPGMAGF